MSEYIIGAGAMLTAGDDAKITPATLHAEVSAGVSAMAKAVAIDFESTSEERLRRVLIISPGWNRTRFEREVTAGLIETRVCSLADVLIALASATGESEVHLFAHWLPQASTLEALASKGVRLVVHPLETIERAALVEAQTYRLITRAA